MFLARTIACKLLRDERNHSLTGHYRTTWLLVPTTTLLGTLKIRKGGYSYNMGLLITLAKILPAITIIEVPSTRW